MSKNLFERHRDHNHPRRSVKESRELSRRGFFPFPELTEEQNDAIFQARIAGMTAFYPMVPDAKAQAENTLKAAREYLDAIAGTEGATP